MLALISSVVVLVLSRFTIDFHIARSLGDSAFSLLMFAAHLPPSKFAISHSSAMRSSDRCISSRLIFDIA